MDVSEFPVALTVTTDFAETVELSDKLPGLDSYQRPVHWILTSFTNKSGRRIVEQMVIISPFEANQLHADLLKSQAVMMHVYAARQNRSFSSLDGLNLYTIPSVSCPIDVPTPLRVQLNLFAGQLYISSMEE
jgi:hypothetical protein